MVNRMFLIGLVAIPLVLLSSTTTAKVIPPPCEIAEIDYSGTVLVVKLKDERIFVFKKSMQEFRELKNKENQDKFVEEIIKVICEN